MKIKITKNFILIILLVLMPWFNANYFDNIKPPNSTENYEFYEANPCKVSLFEFIYSNKEFLNFELEGDSYSSILCFGRISQIKDNKTISIGTNFLMSTTFYMLFIIFLLNNKKSMKVLKLQTNYLKISYLSLLFTLLIFSDRKFYVTKFYFLDPFKFRTYVLIFIFVFLISILLIEVYQNKQHHLINLLPYVLLFSGVVSESNLNIFSIIIIYLGIESISLNRNHLRIFKIYILINCLWTLNAREIYILQKNIYPGFSSTSYDFYSIFIYSIFFIIFLLGAYKFVLDNINFFSYKEFMKNFSTVVLLIIFLNIFNLKINIIGFFNKFFNPQNTESIIYYDFFDLFRFDERILFLFIIIFLFKFVITRKIQGVDYLPMLLIFLVAVNYSSFISTIHNKYDLTKKFFNIYNPTFLEFFLGSGPLNFNQLYIESNYQIILNQHLFLTSFLLFFGFLGGIVLFIFLLNYFKNNFLNKNRLFFTILLFANFAISDTINYLPIFLVYVLFFVVFKKESFNS